MSKAIQIHTKMYILDSKTDEKALIKSVVDIVRHSIGPVASFKQAVIIDKLPKTRSGKIARATLKACLNGKPFKVTTK